jgi:regulator of RNase E activity RraA
LIYQLHLTPDRQSDAYNGAGAIVAEAVRDVRPLCAIGFPVFAKTTSAYDS